MKALTVFAAAALVAGSALAQGTNVSANITAPAVPRRSLPPQNPAQTEGALQRGIRLGNPAQMFNPFASQKYGTWQEFVTPREEHDIGQRPRDNSRPQAVGLRLVTFTF